MQSPQTLTRRIVPALAVTVVATLVFGAIVVTADVATDDSALLPESFAVAAPQQGDAWRYNVTLSGDWTFGLEDNLTLGEPHPFATYQWAGAGRTRGGDGAMHDANYFHAEALHYTPLWIEEQVNYSDEPLPPIYIGSDPEIQMGPSQDPYWNLVEGGEWVAAGGQSIVSRGEIVSTNESSTEYGFGGGFPGGVGQGYQDDYYDFGFIEYPLDEAPCLVFNPMQGANVSLASDIVLFDACRFGGEFLTVPEGLAFRASAIDDVSGVQAIRFDARQNGTYSVWFTPSVPYPVRIAFSLPSERPEEIELGDRDLPGARSAVLDMVGFAAGNGTFAIVDTPSDGAPELVLADAMKVGQTRIGMDETGLVHPFPLSEAFTAAVDEETGFADLKTFLQHYPDAYVAAANYIEGNEVYYPEQVPTSGAFGEYAYVWTITMSGGQEVQDFTIAKQQYSSFAPLAVRGPFDNATKDVPMYSFARGSSYYGAYYGPSPYPYESELGRTPYPASAPAQLPTVASLAERWAVFDGSSTELNAYGFAISCAPSEDEEVCDVQVAYTAGHRRQVSEQAFYMPFPTPTDPYGTEAQVHIDRQVAFQEDGRALFLSIFDQQTTRSSTSRVPHTSGDDGGQHSDGSNEPGYDVRSVNVAGIPSPVTQWVPEGKQAAGIGFMGIIVGALYWIWPKLGMVGLFSRLERGELLDHPARAKLVQIVESQPGIHFHDLALKAELANGTAVHHLRKLSDSGHINVRRSGRYTCYFPGGRVDPGQAAAAPLLKSDGAKQVLEAVRAKPGMSNLEVAQATGLQPSTVNYHVQRLSQAGLLAALRDGRSVRLHPGIRLGNDPANPGVTGAASAA